MHWDVVFADFTIPNYFDCEILNKKPLGGTEASVIRVAEGLGASGLKVAVVLGGCKPFKTKKSKYCTFIHALKIEEADTCDHYVEIKMPLFPHLFQGAKNYLWIHNPIATYGLSPADRAQWIRTISKHKIKLIAVSKWHMKDLRKYFPSKVDITSIYNPLEDSIFSPVYKKNRRANQTTLVWTASPHKGLDKALKLFKRIQAQRPSLELKIFNPGYIKTGKMNLNDRGVKYLGGRPCSDVWKVVSGALCVFYPVNQVETFGCIASEANALGTPVITYDRGGIAEVVSSKDQLVKVGADDELVRRVIDWHDHGTPTIRCRKEFKLQAVIKKWIKLFRIK